MQQLSIQQLPKTAAARWRRFHTVGAGARAIKRTPKWEGGATACQFLHAWWSMTRADTKVLTAHVPVGLAAKLDAMAARLERSPGWVIKQTLAA
jgi:hypothetical protein